MNRVRSASPDLLRALELAAPGAVHGRAFDRLANAHDASHYLLVPDVVARPKDAAQVGSLLAASAAQNVSVTFRSGGTSLSGQACTHGVDTRSNFRAIEVPTDHGRLPVVCDASSCTEGLERLTVGTERLYPGLRIVDAVEFVDEHILGALTIATRIDSLALHPTCSSTQLGTNDALSRVAEEVVIPDGWGCCGFAGDRGMLHTELTASATRHEAAAIADREFSAYASTNRTCELGMARATGHPDQHVLEVLAQVTR